MCEVIPHEYGHLLGYDHSTVRSFADPEDVMNPYVRPWSFCEAFA